MPSGPSSSEAGLTSPAVIHAHSCTEPIRTRTDTAGHADQHRHTLSTHRSTNGTNGLIWFPSLADPWCWVPCLTPGAEAYLQQPGDSLERDVISVMASLGLPHLPFCPGPWSSQGRSSFRLPHLLLSLCAPCMYAGTYSIISESSLAISLPNTDFSGTPERQY